MKEELVDVYDQNRKTTGKIINRVHSPSAIVEVQTTSTGYTIYYYDSEHNSRIVRFPTWTTNNGQDDLQEQWYVANQTTRHECNALLTEVIVVL